MFYRIKKSDATIAGSQADSWIEAVKPCTELFFVISYRPHLGRERREATYFSPSFLFLIFFFCPYPLTFYSFPLFTPVSLFIPSFSSHGLSLLSNPLLHSSLPFSSLRFSVLSPFSSPFFSLELPRKSTSTGSTW